MAELTKKACNLSFDEFELIEFFGIVVELDEDACSYTYNLNRDGLSLEFTIFPLDGGVYTSIYRDGITEPIVKSHLEDCSNSRVVQYGSYKCLEIGRPERPTSESSVPLAWGLRLFVEPHFRIEYIHEGA